MKQGRIQGNGLPILGQKPAGLKLTEEGEVWAATVKLSTNVVALLRQIMREEIEAALERRFGPPAARSLDKVIPEREDT